MEFDVEQLTRFETAHIAGGEYLGLNTDSEITLQHEVTLGAGTQTELWLQENRKTINDVKVDHQEITGVWRSVKIESKQSTTTKNAVNVFQTFYKGWIEDLVSGSTINWDEARLLKSNHWHEAETKGEYPVTEANNPQQYHLIEWQGIDPEKINGIAAEIRALTPTAITPVINGEALGSGFYILDTLTDIEQNRQEGDKSGVITMLIGKTRVNLQAWENYGTPAQSKIYYLYDVPIYIAQTLINIYNKREGATASASQPNEKSLVAIIIRDKVDFDFEYDNITEQSCAYFVKTSYYYGIATPLDVPAHSMGTIYRGRFDIQKETGLYSGYIEERVRQTQHVVPYRSENTHGHYTDNERWTGVYLIDGLPEAATLSVVSGNIVKTMSTITLPDNTIPLGFTWSVSKQANDDCTIDIVINERTEKSGEDVEYDSADSNTQHTSATEKYNQEAVDVTLAAGVNEVLRASVRYNKETGLLDVTEDSTVSKATEGQDKEESAAATRTVTKSIMTDTKPVDPLEEAGKVKTTQWEETEFDGRYRATESVIEVKDQEASGGSARADQTSVVSTNTQATAEEPATPIEGKIVNVSNRPTEAGRYAVSKETITPIDQPGEGAEIRADRTSDTETATQADAPADDAPIERKIVQAQSSPTEFGKYRTSKTVITPINQTTTHDSVARADQTAIRVVDSNADAKQDAAPVPGKVVNASSKENEFGKFDNTLETIAPINQPGEGSEIRADRTSDTETATQADDPADDAPIAGKIVQAQSSPTEFGKYRTSKTVITPERQTTTHTSTSRADQEAERVIDSNADAKQDATPVPGKVVNASSKENEFGKFDNTLETITPIDQEGSSGAESHGETMIEVTHTQTLELAAPVEAAGKIVDNRSVPTAFGKFQTTSRERAGKLQEVDNISETRADQSSLTEWERNAVAQADATAVEGKIVRATSRENDFGLFDNVKETITPERQTTTHTSTSRADQTAERVIDSNAATKQDATAVEGKIVNASSRENEFGKFDNTLETISPEYQTTTHTSTSRADQTAERVIDSNAATKQDATAVEGKIVNASSRENEFGKFDNTLETITPEDQESTDDAKDLYVNQSTEKHTQGEDPVIVPFTAGTIKRVASSPTEFGKKRTAEETRTAQAVSDASKVTTVDYFTAQETSGDRNQTDFEPDVLALEGTTIKISKWSRNEFDRYDNEETTLTPTARDSGWIPYIDANGTSYKREFRNQVVPLVDGYTDDTNNSLSFSMNKHSLYDGSGSRTAKSEEDYGTIWRSTRTDERTEKRYRRIEDVDPILGKIMRVQYTNDTRTHNSEITTNYSQADQTFSNYYEELDG